MDIVLRRELFVKCEQVEQEKANAEARMVMETENPMIKPAPSNKRRVRHPARAPASEGWPLQKKEKIPRAVPGKPAPTQARAQAGMPVLRNRCFRLR